MLKKLSIAVITLILVIVAIFAIVALCLPGGAQYSIARINETFGNEQKALEWFVLSAEKGDESTQYKLGKKYYYGRGAPQNYNEAAKWFTRAALSPLHPLMRSSEAWFSPREFNHLLDCNDVKFVFFWEPSDGAQYCLAEMYAKGEGVQKDYNKAVYWFMINYLNAKAFGQSCCPPSHYDGMINPPEPASGMIYDRPLGLVFLKDANDRLVWLTKCAEYGDIQAYFKLGSIYYFGIGVQRHYEEAFKWYNEGAQKAYKWYHEGDGGFSFSDDQMSEKKYKELAEFLHYRYEAEQEGYAQSQYWIGLKYYLGQTVQLDYKEAIKWLTKAAMQGHAKAQFSLGQIYEKGHGVMEDYVEAYKWYLLAGINNVDASENKKQLQELMTADQIAEAQRLAKALSAGMKASK